MIKHYIFMHKQSKEYIRWVVDESEDKILGASSWHDTSQGVFSDTELGWNSDGDSYSMSLKQNILEALTYIYLLCTLDEENANYEYFKENFPEECV